MHQNNVLLGVDSLRRGGIETLVAGILHNSKKSIEYNYYILCPTSLIEYKKLNDLVNRSVFVIPREHISKLGYILKLRTFLIQHKITVVHSHSPIIGIYLLLAAWKLGICHYQTVHGFWDKRSTFGKRQPIHQLLTDVLYLFTKQTFMVSNFLREHYLNRCILPYQKSVVLYNGINISADSVAVSRGIKDHNSSIITFGMLGNFNYGRNHHTLIRAFSRLHRRNPRSRLILGGTGPLYEDLIKLINDLGLSKNIRLVGKVIDTANFFCSIDCYVYSSRFESFGLTLLEAIDHNLPVIVSDNGPFREILEGFPFVQYFKAEDISDLVNKLQSFISCHNYKESNATVEESRNFLRKYCIENHLANLESYYSRDLTRQKEN